MLSFDNTKIAFQSKSNYELKKAYWLYKIIGNQFFVLTGKKAVNFSNKINLPISWIIKPTVYNHFCGGETINECLPVVKKLQQYNVKSILDYSVEGKENEKEIQQALDETIRTIKNAATNESIPFAVFKPTAFASGNVLKKKSLNEQLNVQEKKEAEKFKIRVNKLCQTAFDNNVPIMIDAEDVWFQHFIDTVVEEMMEKYNKNKAIVYNTLQMYRKDRYEYLTELHKKSINKGFFIGIKFVRGAYMEKERERARIFGYKDPIHSNKKNTDNSYNAGLKYALEHIDRISIFNGTHNEKSSAYLTELIDLHKISKSDSRIWFSQLYGMSDHISFNLGHKGYNVAKYIPYGPIKHVTPYLIRRAEENTSVAGQSSRELELLKKELIRRKKNKKNNN